MIKKVFEKRDSDIVIVSAARTAVGKFGGSLANISAIDLGAHVVKAAVDRANIDFSLVDECVIGQVGSWGPNGFVARAISLKAGLPEKTCAYSVNRQCGSGLQALVEGIMEIRTGQSEVVVAGGAENLSQLPYYVTDARWGAKMGHKTFEDGVLDILTWPLDESHNGTTAENVAKQYKVSREEQDAFAAQSQARAARAIENGIYEEEIVPIEIIGKKHTVTIFNTDEGVRSGTTEEKLSKLKPCFVFDGTGTVTAGNSSSLNDAAAALVLMTRKKADELGCTPMATIEGYTVAGFKSELMGYSPYYSTRKLEEQLGLDVREIDMIEINEAFASQTVAVSRDLGLDMSRVNKYGGGISIGHPIGATGAILACKVAYEFKRGTSKDALITMCIGGGQGMSMYLRAE